MPTLLHKNTLAFLLTFFVCQISAQFNCPDSLIYGSFYGNVPFIRVYNPAKPHSPTNPSNTAIPTPQNLWAGGLALMPNLNGGLSPTLYATLSNFHIVYWSGSTWIDTGHMANPTTTTTLGNGLSGCSGALYNMIFGPLLPQPVAEIYKYTGNGNAVLLFTVPMNDFVYDLVNDCQCNLYLIGPAELRKYSPNGVLLSSTPVTGIPGLGSSLNNFAIIGDDIYVCSSNNIPLYHAKLNNSLISFSVWQFSWAYLPPSQTNFASCPFSTVTPVSASISTATLGCVPNTVTLAVTASLAQAAFQWSGPSVIPPSNGSQVAVGLPGVYNCTVTQTGCDYILANLVTTVASNSTVVTPVINPSITLCYEPNTILNSSLSSTLYTNVWSNSTTTVAGISYSVNAPGIYNLQSTNIINGCSGSASATILATPNIVLGLNTNTMCVFSNDQKDKIVLYPSGGNSYTIVTPPGFTAQISPSQPIVIQQQAPPYGIMGTVETVTLYGSNGVCSTSATANFTLLPLNNFSLSPTSTIVCINKDQTIFGTGAKSYRWNPAESVTTLNDSVFIVKTDVSRIYNVSASDKYGCLMPPLSATISTFPNITGNLVGMNSRICAPGDGHVKFVADTGFHTSSSWTINTSIFETSEFIYHFSKADEYLISGIVIDTNTHCSNKIDFKIQTFPKPKFTVNYIPLTPVELLDDVTLTTVPFDNFQNNFDWFLYGNLKNTGNSISTVFESAGQFPIAIVATNEFNCIDTLITIVKVKPLDYFYLPNAFTPNNDGLNDIFLPVSQEVSDYTMIIFDRWGGEIFKTADLSIGWDGTFEGRPCPIGEYNCKVFLKKNDGTRMAKVGAIFLNR